MSTEMSERKLFVPAAHTPKPAHVYAEPLPVIFLHLHRDKRERSPTRHTQHEFVLQDLDVASKRPAGYLQVARAISRHALSTFFMPKNLSKNASNASTPIEHKSCLVEQVVEDKTDVDVPFDYPIVLCY